MPLFSYQAKQGPTNVVSGTIDAPNQEEAVSRLLRQGLVPVVILIKGEDLDGAPGRPSRLRVSAKERRLFTRQLTSLLKAKVELVPAVGMLRDQSPSRALRAVLDDLDGQMRDGNSFSSTIARHPRVFSPLFASAIRAGEAAGKLDNILLKLVEFDEQQAQLESRLKGALAYPILLLLIGIGCLGFFLWFVVPRMSSLFTQLGGALPGPTKLLIAFSHGLSQYWMAVLGFLVVMAWLVPRIARMPAVIAAAERVLRHVPLTRDIIEARQVGRFTRTLQLLLDSGLSVFHALDVARPTLSSALMEARMREAQERVKQGESIAKSLQAAKCFPSLVIHMIAVGESAGTLVDVLDEMASYYERSLDETLKIATALIEPLMIVLMGILVGFCVLAMVLPIFQMTQIVQ